VAGINDISSVWKNIKEIDLKPIRDSATHPLRIAVVGAEGSGRRTLAEQMRSDPARPGVYTQSPLTILPLIASMEPPEAHLIILLVDISRSDLSEERNLVKTWSELGKNVLVFINKVNLVNGNIGGDVLQGWHAPKVIYGAVEDIKYLQAEFVTAMEERLPQQQLALGRQFPLFRLSIARQLINEVCYSNAAYAFSTGLAEIVPVLDIPLNVADMMVLTKSQAFLAYKLGLLLGFSTRWHDYVTEFGSVIGSGFLWRQIARQLIGLVPGWGIVPKVAVAYSGTYVVGNAILGWYLTGRKLTPQQMRDLYAQAFTRGKEYARKLGERIPKPRLGKPKREKLPALQKASETSHDGIELNAISSLSQEEGSGEFNVAHKERDSGKDVSAINAFDVEAQNKAGKKRSTKRLRFTFDKKNVTTNMVNKRICPKCGKNSSQDASYCQYCGNQFDS
jgi:uncharacterized protein (DUF697 family)/ribosomal protein L40E